MFSVAPIFCLPSEMEALRREWNRTSSTSPTVPFPRTVIGVIYGRDFRFYGAIDPSDMKGYIVADLAAFLIPLSRNAIKLFSPIIATLFTVACKYVHSSIHQILQEHCSFHVAFSDILANCDFDEGTFCDWRPSVKSIFSWSLGSGPTKSGEESGGLTGPSSDASGKGKTEMSM